MMQSPSQRFLTLDVFRGLTVFLMIVVNTPGSGVVPYSPLLHAEWHGLTLTDLVFPSFLFAVGNALAISMQKAKQKGTRNAAYKILKRAALIFLIGYLLSWVATIYVSPDWHFSITGFSNTRLLAVLQRIGLAYGIAGLLSLWLTGKKMIGVSVALLLLYWLLLLAFGDTGSAYSVQGNAVRKLDLLLIGEAHMYREKGIVFDPEGWLSTIPAVVNVIIGWLAGRIIQKKGISFETTTLLMLAGAIAVFAGLFWSLTFPLNKKLWTSSFVLVTSGIALTALGVLFYFYEIRKFRFAAHFFGVFGKNPLFIYILAALLGIFFQIPVAKNYSLYSFFSEAVCQRIFPGPFGSLVFAIGFTMFCWLVGWMLDKRKIYIRV